VNADKPDYVFMSC